jgi:hypothetical protein
VLPRALVARVDAKLAEQAASATPTEHRRSPHKAAYRYLLSGLITCAECGDTFEARYGSGASTRKRSAVYTCASRRRSPGSCSSRLELPLHEMDDAVLASLEELIFSRSLIDDLLACVDDAPASTDMLRAEQDRLRSEIARVVDAVAAGHLRSEDAGAKIAELRSKIEEATRNLQRQATTTTTRAKLRSALERRCTEWKSVLRSSPQVARSLIRRLIGPITLRPQAPFGFVPLQRPGFGRLSSSAIRWSTDFRTHALAEGLLSTPALGHSGTQMNLRLQGELRLQRSA